MAKKNKKKTEQAVKNTEAIKPLENEAEVVESSPLEQPETIKENDSFLNKVLGVIKSKGFLLGVAAFVVPSLILYLVYILNGLHPFGNGQVLVTDLWHQYYPFLCTLQEKLKAGESLLYAENIGMGVNFWALIAYYCASPLNFLVQFVSKEGLRDLVAVLITLKVGFAGLFFSLYLKKVYKKYEFSTIAFSSLYALCGYVLGYYWNIMWLDCVALLPLVMLGVYSIIKENKFILYAVSLAIAVVSNFYIGFMLCIFTAIYFFAECIKEKLNLKEFFKKLGIIAVSSIVSLAMTAFMTVPAYMALQDTVATIPKEQSKEEKEETVLDKIDGYYKEFTEDAPKVLGRLASFSEPNPKEEGITNVFSGIISVILLGYFLCSKKIEKREKLVTSGVLLIMFLSLVFNDLDIIWHGMHKPNMVPFRYAFILSFVMITMAYRTYLAEFTIANGRRSKGKFPVGFAVSAAITALVIWAANEKAVIATVIGSIVLAVLYYFMIESFHSEFNEKMKKKWAITLCGFVVAEVVINTFIAVPTVRLTNYDTYYYRGNEIEKLLEVVDADSTYGRVETSKDYILNDPALYGYKGVSTFSSTANANISEFTKKLAICGIPGSNRYYYQTTSPLTNGFLGIEYVIFKDNMKNLNPYLQEVAVESTTEKNSKGKEVTYYHSIYKNTEALPIGFMAESTLLDKEGLTGANAFEIQNDLFRKATGLEGDLYTMLPLIDGDVKNYHSQGNVRVSGFAEKGSFTIKSTGAKEPELTIFVDAINDSPMYAYVSGRKFTNVKVDGTTYKMQARSYILPAGRHEVGEKVQFKFTFESSFEDKAPLTFIVYTLNEELFEQGMKLLRDEPLTITKYESTRIEGTVDAAGDGVLYTSIPYEKGWKLYVDGKETPITPLENAMICVPLKTGVHNIVLEYSPNGFTMGVIISIAAVVIFAALIVISIILQRKKKNG